MSSALLFDLDGTLLDTLDDLTSSVNAALSQLACPTHNREMIKLMIGDGMRALVWRALPDAMRGPAEVDRATTLFRRHYADHWDVATSPYDGIVEALAELKGRQIPLAVISNKPHAFTLRCIEHYFPDTFQIVLGHEDGAPKKPDPAPLRKTAKALGLRPAECAYIGDSPQDMQAARRARMRPVAVSWGFRQSWELAEAHAELILHKPSELTSLA